ncbi:MAG TPA: metallopeptidase TldD-related protein [Herpetosiphonaceae bacterium]|nr:metallopeptidase TldD-related protein [Herpetosiphonaceae bacterium]
MAYIDEIQAAFDGVADIADYRILLGETRGAGVGIRDNDAGSVYSPMSFSDTIGGSFLVQWHDGRLSRGNLDGNSLLRFDQVVDTAREAAYDDPDAAQFLGPQAVHQVVLQSSDVPPLLGERSGYLLETVRLLQEIAARHEAQTLNGGVTANVSESYVRTSRGLDLHVEGSIFSYAASFDGIIGDGFRRRTVVDAAEVSTNVERVALYLEQLRTPAAETPPGTYSVLLHPNVAYSFFDFFIWGNMGGAAVFHGQSAWKREDFVNHAQVMRDDLTVRIEPWKPLGPGSFGWTGEGLPSRPQVYIDQGRLVTPVLDLKFARRLDLPPVTPPGNRHSVEFSAALDEPFEQALAGIENGVLVLSVLGLHTQDRSSGNYSLSAPQALLVRNGVTQGRVKVTLSGNFFDHLRDDALSLVRFVGQESPGFCFPARVVFEAI